MSARRDFRKKEGRHRLSAVCREKMLSRAIGYGWLSFVLKGTIKAAFCVFELEEMSHC